MNPNLTSKQKIVFLGDQSVGKTSIINRFMYDTFESTERPTIGIDFISKQVHLQNKTVKLQLWDTAGQERFRSLIPSYIRDSNVAVIVYDISQLNTFNNLSKWHEDIKSTRGKEVLLVVVGNKADLEDNRQVSTEMGEQKSLEMEAQFFEVSAKTGDNISNMFNIIAGSLPTIDTSHISTPTTHSNLNVSTPQEKIFDGDGNNNDRRSFNTPQGNSGMGVGQPGGNQQQHSAPIHLNAAAANQQNETNKPKGCC